MKCLVPNYSCFQNPWIRGYRLQIPVLSVLCPLSSTEFVEPPRKKIPGYATVYSSLPLLYVMNQMNPVHAFPSHFQTYLNIILPSMPWSSKCFIPSGFPAKASPPPCNMPLIWSVAKHSVSSTNYEPSPASSYFNSLRPKLLPAHLIL